MSILDKIFGAPKESTREKAGATVLEPPPCPHVALVPRWDNATDMGHEELASAFICESCHESFSPGEARLLRATAAERLKSELPGAGEP